MKKVLVLFILVMVSHLSFAQVEKITVNKEAFVAASVDNLFWCMTHIDTTEWKNNLTPLGFKEIPLSQRVNALEYRKISNGINQYVGYDDQYGVVTIMWTDDSGKNSIIKDLEKALKGKETSNAGFYKLIRDDKSWLIGIQSKKAKNITEMITLELEKP